MSKIIEFKPKRLTIDEMMENLFNALSGPNPECDETLTKKNEFKLMQYKKLLGIMLRFSNVHKPQKEIFWDDIDEKLHSHLITVDNEENITFSKQEKSDEKVYDYSFLYDIMRYADWFFIDDNVLYCIVEGIWEREEEEEEEK